MRRPNDAAAKRARTRRRKARRATARATTQLVVVLVGGLLAGGLAVLAAFPDAVAPVPAPTFLGAAAVAGVGTLVTARRLRPLSQGRSRR